MSQPAYTVVGAFQNTKEDTLALEINVDERGCILMAIADELPLVCDIRPGWGTLARFFKERDTSAALRFCTDRWDIYFSWNNASSLLVRWGSGYFDSHEFYAPLELAAIEACLTQQPQPGQMLLASNCGWLLLTPDRSVPVMRAVINGVDASDMESPLRVRCEDPWLNFTSHELKVVPDGMAAIVVATPRIDAVKSWCSNVYADIFLL